MLKSRLRAGALANSEEPDEMPHNVAFHQGLHCLLGQNQSSEKEIKYFFESITGDPSIDTMDMAYCLFEAQWLSGRVLDSRSRGCGFKPHRRHCVVSWSKTLYLLFNTGSTHRDLSQHD